jgi:hypothetical protein
MLGETDSLKVSSYNSSNPPIFLIHGFLNNYTTRFSQRMKNGMYVLRVYLKMYLKPKMRIISCFCGYICIHSVRD